ncbi:MAG: UDP-N-acetylmuramoyl-L-alanine--D-glutamate ligase [Candidatus Omnitrophica bacterium]|nr:UDP-N-acetylmuramoyl-L-alanine--D-glutamate ligase [Candidatus Omnitrophota bacterium]
MMDIRKDKKVVVIGLARSGYACAKMLASLGCEVSVTEREDRRDLRELAGELRRLRVRVELGGHSRALLSGRELTVISPGVPDTALPVQWARQEGIPVISEIECAFRLCPARIVAVTGSNGKTTVTTLISRVIAESGRKVFLCGNIGTPFSQELPKMHAGDFVALEVSSFQLEHITSFKPSVAVVLNCTPNHLDRYRSMEEYIRAKRNILRFQDADDVLILNADDPEVRKWGRESKAQVVLFSSDGGLNPNHAALYAVARALEIDTRAVGRVLSSFSGIEHRLEHVDEKNGVSFINDSKATTLDATLWALRRTRQPVILIAGGKHKGIDYSAIAPEAQRKVKRAVLFGEARDLIGRALEGRVPVDYAHDLSEAVTRAHSAAASGDCVLFSPMCSSFDMFANYEERGRVFKECVRGLAAGGSIPAKK